ncbi:hypothetical protein TNIN_133741, partial [Trichonephila inaurata madagascariensis]
MQKALDYENDPAEKVAQHPPDAIVQRESPSVTQGWSR